MSHVLDGAEGAPPDGGRKATMDLPPYVTPQYLASLELRVGLGTGKPGDRCSIQEYRAWVGLDPSKDDIPDDVSPLVGKLVIQAQDAREEWRSELRSALPLLAGSRGSDALEWRRVYRVLDWSVREAMPTGLDELASEVESYDSEIAAQLTADAARLRAFAPIVDRVTAAAAEPPLRALDLDLARARALDLARARARARARALDLALDLDLDLARALDLALDLDLDLARARARDLARARALDLSPVQLIRELAEMRDPAPEAG